MSETVLLGTWVKPEIKELCKKMADAQGVSLSGYVRSLILKDLDERTFFTTQVKEQIENE